MDKPNSDRQKMDRPDMQKPSQFDDQFFEHLAQESQRQGPDPAAKPASTLKSKIYSRLLQEAAAEGKLQPLRESRDAGYELCFWETFVDILPAGKQLGGFNHCKVCHGRVMGENWEKAPIPWTGCPYGGFQKS